MQNSGSAGTKSGAESKLNKRARKAQQKAEKKRKEAKPLTSNLQFLDPEEIIVGNRFRQTYNLEDLIESIEDKGVVQAITVDTNLRLIAGGRRLAAAKKLGLSKIPALIRPVEDEIDFREVELIENAQREDLTWLERTNLVRAIDDLYKEKYGPSSPGPSGGWSSRKTAELLARSHGSIQRTLALSKGLEVMPDLVKCKTEQEAFKQLKRIEEAVLVKHLRKKQEALIDDHDDEEELPEYATEEISEAELLEKMRIRRVSQAKGNFRIGDALEGLKELADLYTEQESPIRFVEVDPPFGISLQQKKKRSNKEAPSTLDKYEEIDASKYPDFLNTLCPLLHSVAAKDSWLIFWYGPTWTSEVRQALEAASWHVDHIPAVWVKGEEETSGAGQTGSPEIYLARATEFFFVCRKGKPLLAREGRTNVFSHKPTAPSQKYHPTQKPLALYEDILTTFAFPNTVILSPFLGSGAVLLAAYAQKMLGFGFDLNEKNKDRFLIAVQEEYKDDR